MSFDWSQYFDVSRELAEQAKNAPTPIQEARFRASISRAYYAVFGQARDYLRRHDHIREVLIGSNGERINIHQFVREQFINGRTTLKRIGGYHERSRHPSTNRYSGRYDTGG